MKKKQTGSEEDKIKEKKLPYIYSIYSLYSLKYHALCTPTAGRQTTSITKAILKFGCEAIKSSLVARSICMLVHNTRIMFTA